MINSELISKAKAGDISSLLILADDYFYGDAGEAKKSMAFRLYSKIFESDKSNYDALCGIGKCYRDGVGVEKNIGKAIDILKKGAENDNYNCLMQLEKAFKIAYPDDYKKRTFDFIKPLADKGISNAMVDAYYDYRDGEGTEKNIYIAVAYLKIAVNNGCPWALRALAFNLENGDNGFRQDKSRALNLLNKSAEMGHVVAYYSLGYYYYNNAESENDKKLAFHYFCKGAEYGEDDCLNYAGLCYDNGFGTEKNSAMALDFYEKSFARGNMYAPRNIGLMYQNGNGVDVDAVAAVSWFKKSIELGNNYAYLNLALCYANGIGVEKDEKKAFEFYLEAANKGDDTAQWFVGDYYSKGNIVEKDEKSAFEWYKKSADQGNKYALVSLAQYYENGQYVEQSYKKAFELYKDAAEKENAYAMPILASFYYEGIGTQKNLEEAFYWEKKSAENGVKKAVWTVGKMYSEGTGVEQNSAEALKWFELAIENGEISAYVDISDLYLDENNSFYDRKKGLEYLAQGIKLNDSGAKFKLAVRTISGDGLKKDVGRAISLYKKLTEDDDPNVREKSCHNLYLAYIQIDEIFNPDESEMWARKEAEYGNSESLRCLGNYFLNENNRAADSSRGIELLKKSYSYGNITAAVDLAIYYVGEKCAVHSEDLCLNWLAKISDDTYQVTMTLLVHDNLTNFDKLINIWTSYIIKIKDLHSIQALIEYCLRNNSFGSYVELCNAGMSLNDTFSYDAFSRHREFAGAPLTLDSSLSDIESGVKAMEKLYECAKIAACDQDYISSGGCIFTTSPKDNYEETKEALAARYFLLGKKHADDDRPPECYDKSIYWYKKSADLGSVDAVDAIAGQYVKRSMHVFVEDDDNCTSRDYSEAADNLNKALEWAYKGSNKVLPYRVKGFIGQVLIWLSIKTNDEKDVPYAVSLMKESYPYLIDSPVDRDIRNALVVQLEKTKTNYSYEDNKIMFESAQFLASKNEASEFINYTLGECYLGGFGCDRNYDKAYHYLSLTNSPFVNYFRYTGSGYSPNPELVTYLRKEGYRIF